MEKISTLFYPIVNIVRREDKNYEYLPLIERGIVAIHEDGTLLLQVSMARFLEVSERLLDDIKQSTGASFALPHIEVFMSSVKCHALKARSSDKSDIHIVIHDLRTGIKPLLGFSIKSKLGHPSTLLNSGLTTNFVFRVNRALLEPVIRSFNAIPGQMERMTVFFCNGFDIEYSSMDCETFEDNLMIIDTCMPNIIAECIKEHFLSGLNDLKEITMALVRRNPLGVRNPECFYKAKMNSLLIDAALGMTPAKPWARRYDANGGYLVVREDGEVLCYHFYDRNQTEDYLFNNTRFDYPSRSRYDYGYFYEKDGETFIKLNFQVRFK